ncbi:MAG: RNA polymerase sigma factor [Thermoanaerobaculia bacterium]|nr:RNA polymerase sigma factor [Thermoanaerobaculia bacterium]
MELVYSRDQRREESERESDRLLAIQARDGDLVAFEALVTRKTPAVISVARRILGNTEDARDVSQMVFLRVWEQLGRYDDHYSFNTWLYRIATNLSIDFLRSARSREKAHGATLYLVRSRQEDTSGDASRAAEDGEIGKLFQRVSGAMTGKQKAAFVLREMQDCDTREIAEILGCGESTVRNHLFNARKVMRRELAKIYPALLRRAPKP